MAILSAAGFTARGAADEFAPFTVRVLAGPEPGPESDAWPAWSEHRAPPGGADRSAGA
ncbi:hypothetical protein [Kitasatospora sp. NPDC085464]|uniref:hypothetical protein n=1 Tax=Kitasatospora sp. NPDC085464 TaxID=3364063 RepID=UPI0037C7DBE8